MRRFQDEAAAAREAIRNNPDLTPEQRAEALEALGQHVQRHGRDAGMGRQVPPAPLPPGVGVPRGAVTPWQHGPAPTVPGGGTPLPPSAPGRNRAGEDEEASLRRTQQFAFAPLRVIIENQNGETVREAMVPMTRGGAGNAWGAEVG